METPLQHAQPAENLIATFVIYFDSMRRNECDYDLMQKEGIYCNLLMAFRMYEGYYRKLDAVLFEH